MTNKRFAIGNSSWLRNVRANLDMTDKKDIDYFIDRLIHKLGGLTNHSPNCDQLINLDGIFAIEQQKTIEALKRMREMGLIYGDKRRYQLTGKSYEILQEGGWIEYNKKIRQEKKYKKYQAKLFLPITILAAVSSIVSIYKTIVQENRIYHKHKTQ